MMSEMSWEVDEEVLAVVVKLYITIDTMCSDYPSHANLVA